MLKKKVFIFSAIILAILAVATFLVTIFFFPHWPPKEIYLRWQLHYNPHSEVNAEIVNKLAGPAETDLSVYKPRDIRGSGYYSTYTVYSLNTASFGRLYFIEWSGNIAGWGQWSDQCAYPFYDASGNYIIGCACPRLSAAPTLCDDLVDLVPQFSRVSN